MAGDLSAVSSRIFSLVPARAAGVFIGPARPASSIVVTSASVRAIPARMDCRRLRRRVARRGRSACRAVKKSVDAARMRQKWIRRLPNSEGRIDQSVVVLAHYRMSDQPQGTTLLLNGEPSTHGVRARVGGCPGVDSIVTIRLWGGCWAHVLNRRCASCRGKTGDDRGRNRFITDRERLNSCHCVVFPLAPARPALSVIFPCPLVGAKCYISSNGERTPSRPP